MVPDPGANAALQGELFDGDDFAKGRHLHLSGYTLLGSAQSAARQALQTARSTRMTISVDAASAAPLASFGPDAFLGLIGQNLLLFANEAEAEVLTGTADPRRSALLLAERVGWAVVKAGGDGAYFGDGVKESVLHCPAVPLERVVDTTGAGDAFAAMFLAALGMGRDPARALGEAVKIAALACGQVGGRPPADLPAEVTSGTRANPVDG
jgi:sugar/nucleoside kinase (ribokinase family)